MDGQAQSISSQQLYQNLGTGSAPILVDVRRQDAFGNDDRLIIGALRRPPDEVERWREEFSAANRRLLQSWTRDQSGRGRSIASSRCVRRLS